MIRDAGDAERAPGERADIIIDSRVRTANDRDHQSAAPPTPPAIGGPGDRGQVMAFRVSLPLSGWRSSDSQNLRPRWAGTGAHRPARTRKILLSRARHARPAAPWAVCGLYAATLNGTLVSTIRSPRTRGRRPGLGVLQQHGRCAPDPHAPGDFRVLTAEVQRHDHPEDNTTARKAACWTRPASDCWERPGLRPGRTRQEDTARCSRGR